MSDTHKCPNCGAFPVDRPGPLERELAQAREDAERYRWLRNRPDTIDWGHSLKIPNDATTWEFGDDRGKLLDAAIDAARNAAQAVQNAAGREKVNRVSESTECSPGSNADKMRESGGSGSCSNLTQSIKASVPDSPAPAAPKADAQGGQSVSRPDSHESPAGGPASSALVLVPSEPTKEMLGAAFREIMKAPKGTKDGDSMRIFYRAMLAAAPASGPSEEAKRLHDQIDAMIDQIGHPDYSLRELVDGLRDVRDALLRLAGEKP